MSDILIRGMEMPTKENVVILISPNGDVWMIGNMPNEDTHLVKAKAVPVPPHGRLIDADALYEDCALDTNIEVMASAKRINEYMQLKIDNAPTIIEAEEEET